MRLSEADVEYIRARYRTLDELCAGRPEAVDEVRGMIECRLLPRASYVLDDGTWMFPPDYFRLVDEAGGVEALREHFRERHRAAARAAPSPVDELEADWQSYLDGTYGICLREVTPETIVRKGTVVAALCELLVLARPGSAEWRAELRERVDELDGLEREFAPDADRSLDVERPPTRDLLIEAARRRFPYVFAAAEAR